MASEWQRLSCAIKLGSEVRNQIPAGSDETLNQVIKTACELCAWSCGMDVHVENGKITKVRGTNENPLNRGVLCPKGVLAKEYVYAEDRLKYPLLKSGRDWKRITWKEAIGIVADKLKEVKAEASSKSFAAIIGMPLLLGGSSTVGFIRRFMDVYGSPNCFSPESMCYRHQIIGNILTLGKFSVADVDNARCVVVWGHNPHESKYPLALKIEEAKGRGSKLVVIDPRRTKLAKMADLYAQVRPGSDCALALGMMKVIVENKLYDKDFVDKWCTGFEPLRQHLSKLSLDEISRLTWVDENAVREIARTFALTKPSCVVQGVNALDQHPSGIQNTRAIVILHALTGNLDVKGGLIRASRVHTNNLRLFSLLKDSPLGIEKHPLFYQVWGTHLGEGQAMYFHDALENAKPYPIKAMIIAGSNPLLTWPNSSRLRSGLEKLEFLAVMDVFMTETAELAGLVLPVATFLERLELCDYYSVIFGIPYLLLRKKAIDPPHEAKSDLDFWLLLAKEMGYHQYFPWNSAEEVINYVLEPTRLTVKDLLEKYPAGLKFGEVMYGEYEKRGFKTPSGKVEIYSKTLEELGHHPLPTHMEPLETPLSKLAEDYPLILTTGARVLPFTHSQLRNIKKLRERMPKAVAEINPETARKYRVRNGESVMLKTQRGSIRIGLEFTEDIAPSVVNISHGWAEANVNLLTSQEPADPISGCPGLSNALQDTIVVAQRVVKSSFREPKNGTL